MPTYNKAESLRRLVPELMEVFGRAGRSRYEIIIVDDNSPDGTGAVADELAAAHPGLIHVVHRPGKAGLGTAVVAGWEVARAPILAAMDADGQHPPGVLIGLLRGIEGGADLAVASRYAAGGATLGWNPLRLLGSRLGTLFTRLLLPGVAHLRDPLSGCFALRREVIAGKELQPLGYKIVLEVLAYGDARKIIEVPYTFSGRQAGRRSLHALGAFLAHLLVLAWVTGNFHRLARFLSVGFSGTAISLGLLALLRELTPLALVLCGAASSAVGLLVNFFLNEFWTFADWSRHDSAWRSRLHRLAKFLAICAGGVLAYLVTLLLLTHFLGVHYLWAGAAGVVVSALWNYGLNANVTWRAPRLAA